MKGLPKAARGRSQTQTVTPNTPLAGKGQEGRTLDPSLAQAATEETSMANTARDQGTDQPTAPEKQSIGCSR